MASPEGHINMAGSLKSTAGSASVYSLEEDTGAESVEDRDKTHSEIISTNSV